MYKNKKFILMGACLLSMASLLPSDLTNIERTEVSAGWNYITDTVASAACTAYTYISNPSLLVPIYKNWCGYMNNNYSVPGLQNQIAEKTAELGVVSALAADRAAQVDLLCDTVDKAADYIGELKIEAARTAAQALVDAKAQDAVLKVAQEAAKKAATPVIVTVPSPVVAPVATAPVVKTPEIKTESWGDSFNKWGIRAKYALIAGAAIGVTRTAINAYQSYSLSNEYDHLTADFSLTVYSQEAFIKKAHVLASAVSEKPADLEKKVQDEAYKFVPTCTNIQTAQAGIAGAISKLKNDIYKLSYLANIRIPCSFTELVTNPERWQAFENKLKAQGMAAYTGVVGIALGADYYYGHEDIIKLARNLVLRAAALEMFNRCLTDQTYREANIPVHRIAPMGYPVRLFATAGGRPEDYVRTTNSAANPFD